MKQMKGTPVAQGGFTLVEIAIVLVIVGLLLGGVLQGQSLIENSRVRSAINQVGNIQAAIAGYQDRYGQLPGDDGAANLGAFQARGGAFASVTQIGNRDGLLTGPAPAVNAVALFTTPATEVLGLWQHLRAAGFISGDVGAVAANTTPASPWGRMAVTGLQVYGVPVGSNKLCFNNVPASAAQSIDQRLDDGINNTGRVRAATLGTPAGSIADAAAPAAAAYVEGSNYVVCVTI